MKQTLQLKLGQHLTMTPQLQQAIRLLQLSTLDLQQEIQEALDSNMMLEPADDASQLENDPMDKGGDSEGSNDSGGEEMSSTGSQTEIPDELPVDTSWEDVYDNVRASTSALPASEQADFEFQRPISETLRQHLMSQIELERFSEQDSAIAMAIVDSINDHGYLVSPVSDIHQGLLSQLEDLELDEVKAVLHRVQNFDPPGVGALDLVDCLFDTAQSVAG